MRSPLRTGPLFKDTPDWHRELEEVTLIGVLLLWNSHRIWRQQIPQTHQFSCLPGCIFPCCSYAQCNLSMWPHFPELFLLLEEANWDANIQGSPSMKVNCPHFEQCQLPIVVPMAACCCYWIWTVAWNHSPKPGCWGCFLLPPNCSISLNTTLRGSIFNRDLVCTFGITFWKDFNGFLTPIVACENSILQAVAIFTCTFTLSSDFEKKLRRGFLWILYPISPLPSASRTLTDHSWWETVTERLHTAWKRRLLVGHVYFSEGFILSLWEKAKHRIRQKSRVIHLWGGLATLTSVLCPVRDLPSIFPRLSRTQLNSSFQGGWAWHEGLTLQKPVCNLLTRGGCTSCDFIHSFLLAVIVYMSAPQQQRT